MSGVMDMPTALSWSLHDVYRRQKSYRIHKHAQLCVTQNNVKLGQGDGLPDKLECRISIKTLNLQDTCRMLYGGSCNLRAAGTETGGSLVLAASPKKQQKESTVEGVRQSGSRRGGVSYTFGGLRFHVIPGGTEPWLEEVDLGTEGTVNWHLKEMAGGQGESLAQMLREWERSERLNSGWRVWGVELKGAREWEGLERSAAW